MLILSSPGSAWGSACDINMYEWERQYHYHFNSRILIWWLYRRVHRVLTTISFRCKKNYYVHLHVRFCCIVALARRENSCQSSQASLTRTCSYCRGDQQLLLCPMCFDNADDKSVVQRAIDGFRYVHTLYVFLQKVGAKLIISFELH